MPTPAAHIAPVDAASVAPTPVAPASVASAPVDLARCDFCRRPISVDDVSVTVYRDGVPRASYHEGCRPDRRRSGCSGSAC